MSFVATITRRQIYNFYQDLKVVEYLDDHILKAMPDRNSETPERIYSLTRQRRILMEAMMGLSERDYRLVKMLFLDPDEPSYKEIASKLKMPVSSIGPIRAKVLAKLYRVLKSKKRNLGVFLDSINET